VRLQSFLLGAGAATAATVAAALATSMTWWAVTGLALSVWVASQLLYVGLVSHMAAQRAGRADPAERGYGASRLGMSERRSPQDGDKT
jgi:hypothetical protein